MLNILGLLGVTVLLFSTATVCVKYSRKCSVEEAVIEVTTYFIKYIVHPMRWICKEVWKELFGTRACLKNKNCTNQMLHFPFS